MRKPLALLSAALLIVTACTGGGATPSPTSGVAGASAPPAAAPSAAASAPAAAGEATVMIAESDLGQILVDAEGRTLYMFTPDEGGEPTCYDQCAANWPPLVVDGEPVAGDGVEADLTTVERTDGEQQVMAGEWPLYYFANDAAPGDTNGQGVGEKWYVVGPDGEPIQ